MPDLGNLALRPLRRLLGLISSKRATVEYLQKPLEHTRSSASTAGIGGFIAFALAFIHELKAVSTGDALLDDGVVSQPNQSAAEHPEAEVTLLDDGVISQPNQPAAEHTEAEVALLDDGVINQPNQPAAEHTEAEVALLDDGVIGYNDLRDLIQKQSVAIGSEAGQPGSPGSGETVSPYPVSTTLILQSGATQSFIPPVNIQPLTQPFILSDNTQPFIPTINSVPLGQNFQTTVANPNLAPPPPPPPPHDLVATLSSTHVLQASPVSVTVADGGTTVTASTYLWQVSHDSGSTWSNAAGSGATSATYTPTEGDEGGTLQVLVTYASDPASPESATSNTSAAVAESATNDLVATLDSTSAQQGTAVHVTVTDGATPVTASTYQWQVSHDSGATWTNAIGTGTASASYTPTEADEGGTLQVLVTYASDPASPESATSNISAAVAESATNDLVATLDSTSAQQGTAVHVTVTDGATPVTASTYQWQVSHDSGATWTNAIGTGTASASYTPTEADEGGTLQVLVTYASDPASPESATSNTSAAVAESATNDLVATLDSTSAQQGTAVHVTVTDGATPVTASTYQWQVSHDSGATWTNAIGTGTASASYTPTEADEGGTLQVLVTYASDPASPESATSNISAAVAESATNDLVATLDSTSAQQGTAVHVTVADGGTTVTASTYLWQVSHDSGATWTNAIGTGTASASYTPTEADEGGTLQVLVTYASDPASPESATSNISAAVAESATNDLVATLDSTSAQQGTAVHVTVTDGATPVTASTYQWQVSHDSGATWTNAIGTGTASASYTPTEADEGGTLQVLVTYASDPASPESATSNTSAAVAESATNDLVATLDSTSAQQGTAVHVTVTDGATPVTASTYQWQVSHDSGSTWSNAAGSGATSATYTPTEGDEGGTLQALVTYASDPSSTENATSNSSGTIQDSADLLTTVSGLTGGNAVQGTAAVVGAVTDGGVDVTATATYQWQINNGSGFSNINNATGSSYTPLEADEGGTLQVIVSYSDPGNSGGIESITKSAGTIQDSADLTATLTGLTGVNAVQGTAVNVTNVQDSGTGVTATYQWVLNGSNISATNGGTAASYTPTESDEGGTLQVIVSSSDPGNSGGIESITKSAGTIQDSADLTATLTGLTGVNAVQGTAVNVTNVQDSGTGVTATYQWQLNGSNISATNGGTAASYTPTESDEGGTLQVIVSYSDPGNTGGIESITKSAGTIQDSADLTATLTGLTGVNAVQGTAVLWHGEDGGVDVTAGATYQWQLNGSNHQHGFELHAAGGGRRQDAAGRRQLQRPGQYRRDREHHQVGRHDPGQCRSDGDTDWADRRQRGAGHGGCCRHGDGRRRRCDGGRHVSVAAQWQHHQHGFELHAAGGGRRQDAAGRRQLQRPGQYRRDREHHQVGRHDPGQCRSDGDTDWADRRQRGAGHGGCCRHGDGRRRRCDGGRHVSVAAQWQHHQHGFELHAAGGGRRQDAAGRRQLQRPGQYRRDREHHQVGRHDPGQCRSDGDTDWADRRQRGAGHGGCCRHGDGRRRRCDGERHVSVAAQWQHHQHGFELHAAGGGRRQDAAGRRQLQRPGQYRRDREHHQVGRHDPGQCRSDGDADGLTRVTRCRARRLLSAR